MSGIVVMLSSAALLTWKSSLPRRHISVKKGVASTTYGRHVSMETASEGKDVLKGKLKRLGTNHF